MYTVVQCQVEEAISEGKNNDRSIRSILAEVAESVLLH
jgi:hypothetical protein